VASFTPTDQKEDLSLAKVLIEKADQCLYEAREKGATGQVNPVVGFIAGQPLIRIPKKSMHKFWTVRSNS
jgi:hypothetical protein